MTDPQQASIDLERLTKLVENIGSADSQEAMFTVLNQSLPGLLDADRCSVSLLSGVTNNLEIHAPSGVIGDVPAGPHAPTEASHIWHAIKYGVLTVFAPQPHGPGVEGLLHAAGLRSTALVPLVFGDQRLGTINISSLQPGRFQEEEQKALRHVAYIVSTSIVQRRMLAAAQKAAATEREQALQLALLNELATDLTACMRVDDAHRLGLDAVQKMLPLVDRVNLVKLNDDASEYSLLATIGSRAMAIGTTRPVSNSWLEKVVTDGKATHSKEFIGTNPADVKTLAELGVTNFWSVPITVDHRLRGVLSIGARESLAELEPSLGFMSTIGQLMVIATERLQAQERAEQALQIFIDDSPVLIMAVNQTGMIEKVSRYGAKMLGFKVSDLVGRPFVGLHPRSDRFDAERRLREWTGQSGEAVRSFEVMMRRGRGEHQWIRQSARTVTTVHGEPLTLIACEDIAAVRKLTDELSHQVCHDSLTGLANRAHFEDRLDGIAAEATHSGERIAILFMDIDRFKSINDSHGHGAGDELLRITARRIASLVRASDLVARIGGDEFQMVMRNLRSHADAKAFADKLRTHLNEPMELPGLTMNIGVSIGVALSDGINTDPSDLVKCADVALYRAKELGRNNVQVFSSGLSMQRSQRSFLEQELVRAVENDELRLQLQPRFRACDGAFVAVEALVRWQHPEQGLLGPDHFIPLAEESMLVGRITSWVLSQGVRQLARLQTIWPHMRLGVNVSARELIVNGDLVERVVRELQNQNVEPASLELEITETALCEDLDAGREVLTRLTDMGMQIALDDFGTGYASLSQLVALPIDTVKIDRSFVSALEADGRARSITDALAQLTSNLGIHCVAEGVETLWQAAYLQGIGVDALQGYLLARPLWIEGIMKNSVELEAGSRRLLQATRAAKNPDLLRRSDASESS